MEQDRSPDGSLVARFEMLGRADQKAILKRLSRKERKHLRRALKKKVKAIESAKGHSVSQAIQSEKDLSISPWLKKHIDGVLASKTGAEHRTLSDATRSVLTEIMGGELNSSRDTAAVPQLDLTQPTSPLVPEQRMRR